MVTDAVSTAGIMAVSVGKNALEKKNTCHAGGLQIRYQHNPEYLSILLLAENMEGCSGIYEETAGSHVLPSDYPLIRWSD